MAGAAAVAAQLKSQLDNAKQEIGKAYGLLMNGYQKGDWKVTSQIYGPNCSICPPNQPTIKGKEGTSKFGENGKGN